MKLLKNERGYTLVLVPLTVTIMFPLGAMLMNANINSASQLQTSEAYRSSIAMAEMGVTFASDKIEHTLDWLDLDHILETVNHLNGDSTQPEALKRQVNQEIADHVLTTILMNFPQTQEFDGQSFTIGIEIETVSEDEIIFEVSSIGRAERDYLIQAEVAIATEMEIGSGSGKFDDPEDFRDRPAITTDMHNRIEALVPTSTLHSRPGDNFGIGTLFGESTTLTSSARINPNSSLEVRGDLITSTNIFSVMRNATFTISGSARFRGGLTSEGTANERNRVDIGGSAVFTEAGPGTGINTSFTDTTIHKSATVGRGSVSFTNSKIANNGHFHASASSPVRIENSEVEIGGSVGLSDTNIRIINSDVLIKGGRVSELPEIENVSAMGQPQITGSTVQTGNLRVSQLSLTGSDFNVRGSLRIEGAGGTLNNSTMTVQGNFLTSGGIRMLSGSTLIVYGYAAFPSPGNSIYFEGNGSRVIVYGERRNFPNPAWNTTHRVVERIEDCPPMSNTNLICFVGEEPQSPPSSPSGVQSWGWLNSNLRNIDYMGQPR